MSPTSLDHSLRGIAQPLASAAESWSNPIMPTKGLVMADIDLQELTDRYVAVWNEPDADVRRNTTRELRIEG